MADQSTDRTTGWFADTRDTDDPDQTPGYPWSPYLQSPGLCTPLQIWFASEAECESWIRENVLGKELLDG